MKVRARKLTILQERGINHFIPQAEKAANAAVREVFAGERYSKVRREVLWNRVFHSEMDKLTAGIRTKGPRCMH